MIEANIVYEKGDYWVYRWPDRYEVLSNVLTGGTWIGWPDSNYPRSCNGLSIAKARCDYLAGRKANEAA